MGYEDFWVRAVQPDLRFSAFSKKLNTDDTDFADVQ